MNHKSKTSFSPKSGLMAMTGFTALKSRKSLLVIALGTAIGLAGCQPTSEEATTDSTTQTSQETTPSVVMSESAKAQIARFEEEYVKRKLNLQQSQLAEYEALQAADSPEDNKALFEAAKSADNSTNAVPEKKTVGQKLIDQKRNTENTESAKRIQNENTVGSELTDATVEVEEADSETSISTAANQQAGETTDTTQAKEEQGVSDVEMGQLTLQELPLINLAMVPPEELTAVEIQERYNVAMQALYFDDETPLPAQAIDTLLSVAMLTPAVFNNAELAQRLVLKSPSLARLLKQYQTWEQIERQQSAELEALKQSQSAEFDALAKEFNEKIAAYDEQIKSYEERLKKFK